jgi:hypothetical protein
VERSWRGQSLVPRGLVSRLSLREAAQHRFRRCRAGPCRGVRDQTWLPHTTQNIRATTTSPSLSPFTISSQHYLP